MMGNPPTPEKVQLRELQEAPAAAVFNTYLNVDVFPALVRSSETHYEIVERALGVYKDELQSEVDVGRSVLTQKRDTT